MDILSTVCAGSRGSIVSCQYNKSVECYHLPSNDSHQSVFLISSCVIDFLRRWSSVLLCMSGSTTNRFPSLLLMVARQEIIGLLTFTVRCIWKSIAVLIGTSTFRTWFCDCFYADEKDYVSVVIISRHWMFYRIIPQVVLLQRMILLFYVGLKLLTLWESIPMSLWPWLLRSCRKFS